MVPRERLIKQDEGKERQGIRTQEDQQNNNLRKTYLEFFFPKEAAPAAQIAQSVVSFDKRRVALNSCNTLSFRR
jgi:hypothetical protein